MYKTYKVTIEVDVLVKNKGLIVQNEESVAAGVRHFLRTAIPVGWRQSGLQVQLGTIRTEACEKEVTPNE